MRVKKHLNVTCSLKNTFFKHITSVYEGKKPFKNDFCDYSFSTNCNMKRYVASVHEKKALYSKVYPEKACHKDS